MGGSEVVEEYSLEFSVVEVFFLDISCWKFIIVGGKNYKFI